MKIFVYLLLLLTLNIKSAEFTFEASYFKDSVQILTKCNLDKNKLNIK